MGALYSSLSAAWRTFFNGERQAKVVIVGLNNSGKTTTLYQLRFGEVVDTQPTIGSNVEEVRRGNTVFQCWDLGGQESLRKTWTTYFAATDAVILVVDSTDPARLPTVRHELALLLANEDLSTASILVLANKQDVKGSLSAADLTSSLSLHDIKGRPWHIEGCCALTGEGIDQGLDWVANSLT